MKIQKIDAFGIDKAIGLIWETFLKFEALDYSSEGVKSFQKFVEDKDILLETEFFGAYENGEIRGVIATRNDRKHICCFFVKEQFQRQGIGRKLWEYVKNSSSHNIITVNSSPYAIPIYHKLGFTNTEAEQLKDGIRYTPMEYKDGFKKYCQEFRAMGYEALEE